MQPPHRTNPAGVPCGWLGFHLNVAGSASHEVFVTSLRDFQLIAMTLGTAVAGVSVKPNEPQDEPAGFSVGHDVGGGLQ